MNICAIKEGSKIIRLIKQHFIFSLAKDQEKLFMLDCLLAVVLKMSAKLQTILDTLIFILA
jgi:hypothetical protein